MINRSSYEFIPLRHEREWDAALARWPAGSVDVYFRAAYHRALVDDAAAGMLYLYTVGEQQLLYTFLLRPIAYVGSEKAAGSFYDIEGVYGFSGPAATSADVSFLEEAWAPFRAWCRETNVIAEFIRFNPILSNQRFVDSTVQCEAVREHVILDLTASEEEIWSRYSSVNRNMIRKASKAGVVCRSGSIREFLRPFLDLYYGTMDRNRATPGYYFSPRSFEILADEVPSMACAALTGGKIVAVSIFLLSEDRIHYHLSGAAPEALKVAANNLLLHTMVLESRARGLRTFHFGGGRTSRPDDSLFRFKSNFSSDRATAYIGRRVHDASTFDALCRLRRSQVPFIPENYFLAYRYEPVFA